MVDPLILTDPFKTTWYHGTKAEPFCKWQCPPPRPGPGDVPHSGLFFTAELVYARGAGSNVCTARLNHKTNLIVPVRGDAPSTGFRSAVARSSPIAAYCEWLTNDAVWTSAWATGEVMRFSYDRTDARAVHAISKALGSISANLKRMIVSPITEDEVTRHASICLTRGWIEQLVIVARSLGYQAIQGAEIDQWADPDTKAVARPWLAVMDATVISEPCWQ